MVTIRAVPVDAPDAVALIRSYMTEVVDRYHRRPMPASTVDGALADEPADDVAVLLVAYRAGEPVGCAGLRVAGPHTGELTKVYVAPPARRSGVARRLLASVEEAARERGLRRLRLDTRTDLIEARALYAAVGFREVPAWKQAPFADCFFAKDLLPG
ncbi:GNAT family N-acetyltransferase [Nucisporomicrobium flavum]|uniref:GNAT family N-acetyltransferase n=1 Tax=Nucisporomicrobium flavum TaxID=2785915 RepID=UPI0027DD1F13|nr:GNAT family N-acetyltransferase [Nucisporomicrobium flavum]